jgi:hypothetical protein
MIHARLSLRWLIWPALAVASIMLLTSWFAYARAAGKHANATLSHHQVLNTATEIASLRASQEVTTLGRRPESGLVDVVSSTLATAGVASTALQSLSPEPESPAANLAGVQYMRQRARVQLGELGLIDLGRWLSAWRESSNGWTVAAIDVIPSKPPSNLRPGDQPRLRATIVLEAVYVANPPGSSVEVPNDPSADSVSPTPNR